jgi:hypothetical protein
MVPAYGSYFSNISSTFFPGVPLPLTYIRAGAVPSGVTGPVNNTLTITQSGVYKITYGAITTTTDILVRQCVLLLERSGSNIDESRRGIMMVELPAGNAQTALDAYIMNLDDGDTLRLKVSPLHCDLFERCLCSTGPSLNGSPTVVLTLFRIA